MESGLDSQFDDTSEETEDDRYPSEGKHTTIYKKRGRIPVLGIAGIQGERPGFQHMRR